MIIFIYQVNARANILFE